MDANYRMTAADIAFTAFLAKVTTSKARRDATLREGYRRFSRVERRIQEFTNERDIELAMDMAKELIAA